MMIYISGMCAFASRMPISPEDAFACFAFAILGRLGTSFAQVMSLDLPPTPDLTSVVPGGDVEERQARLRLYNLILGRDLGEPVALIGPDEPAAVFFGAFKGAIAHVDLFTGETQLVSSYEGPASQRFACAVSAAVTASHADSVS